MLTLVTVSLNLTYESFGVNGFQNVGKAMFSGILLSFHKQLQGKEAAVKST